MRQMGRTTARSSDTGSWTPRDVLGDELRRVDAGVSNVPQHGLESWQIRVDVVQRGFAA